MVCKSLSVADCTLDHMIGAHLFFMFGGSLVVNDTIMSDCASRNLPLYWRASLQEYLYTGVISIQNREDEASAIIVVCFMLTLIFSLV